MCKLKYWSTTSNGFIATCSRCQSYHLALGTTMVLLQQHEFERLAQQIRTIYAGQAPVNHMLKQVLVNTSGTKSFLYLSWKEVSQLHALLEGCDTEMTAQAMMDLLENG